MEAQASFLGQYEHSLDEKNRIIVPSKFREYIKMNEGIENAPLIITRGLDKALFLFTKKNWANFTGGIRDFPMTNESARVFVRFFFAGAAEQTPDKQGRLVIPSHLKEFAEIKREIVIIGAMDRIEIWSKENWSDYFSRRFKDIESISETLTQWK